MITIKLEYATAEDAILALAALREKGLDTPDTRARPVVKETTKDKTKETAAGKSATTATSAPPPPTAPAPAPEKAAAAPATKAAESSDSSTAVEYSAVSAAITAAVATHGRDAVLAVLKDSYSAKSGKDLKPEQYAEFLGKLEALGGDGGDLS